MKAGFYAEWRGKYGEEAWGLLEEATGLTDAVGLAGISVQRDKADLAVKGRLGGYGSRLPLGSPLRSRKVEEYF